MPVEISGTRIEPGDIIFGDLDGVLVLPKAAEAEAFEQAFEKVRKEHLIRQALEAGMGTVEAFAKYGVM